MPFVARRPGRDARRERRDRRQRRGRVGAARVENLLRNADVAMYMAKERGKGCYQVFESEMHADAIARLELKADLQRAIGEEQFALHYQPIVDLASGDIDRRRGARPLGAPHARADLAGRLHPARRGLRAHRLARPLDPRGGLPRGGAAPARLPARDPAARWRSTSPCASSSGRAWSTRSRSALAESRIPPSSLTLEITESVMMADADTAVLRLRRAARRSACASRSTTSAPAIRR